MIPNVSTARHKDYPLGHFMNMMNTFRGPWLKTWLPFAVMVVLGCQPSGSTTPSGTSQEDSASASGSSTTRGEGLPTDASSAPLSSDVSGSLANIRDSSTADPVAGSTAALAGSSEQGPESMEEIHKLSDAEWKERLSAQQFYVTREHGTERPFTGEFWDNKRDGIYNCVCCGQALFDSTTKYESKTGWPSFFQPIDEASVDTSEDKKLFYTRIEVHCSRCDAHLGHVFDDGPNPTGLRYCLNSASLDFDERDSTAK